MWRRVPPLGLPTEYELLKFLLQHADKALTHSMLLRAVWGPEYAGESQYLRVYIPQLRRKLEADPTRPRFIITGPGVGYRFRTQE
jgi:two-component system KDP operon response regulator KdpE